MYLNYTLLIGLMYSVTATNGQDLSIYKSKQSVAVTTRALVQLINDSDLTFFDSISYEKIAQEHGVSIFPTKVVMFEDPELTKQLIACQPTTALDLPLKIIVWEEVGDIYIGFIDPRDMRKRFMLSECDGTIDQLSRLMIRLVTDVMRAM